MAIMRCPDCHKKISTSVESCPKCGCIISDDQRAKKLVRFEANIPLILIIVALIIGFIIYKYAGAIDFSSPHKADVSVINTFPKNMQDAITTFNPDVVTAKYLNNHIDEYSSQSFYSCIVYGKVKDIDTTTYGDEIYEIYGRDSDQANAIYGQTFYDYTIKSLDFDLSYHISAGDPKPDISEGNTYYFLVSIIPLGKDYSIVIHSFGEKK